MRRRALNITLALLVAAAALLGWMLFSAQARPIVRQARVELADWPAGARPVRVVLISDVHVAGPDMPPARLGRIVGQINRLRPDIVLIAGDFVSDKRTATRTYSIAEAIAPLQGLRPRLATVAVLGNHDHWRAAGETARELNRAGIVLLRNEATSVGPLRIGGVDDDYTGRADVGLTLARMREGPGAKLLLSHSPDVVLRVPAEVQLILAGHTHCGQIRLPVIGAVSYMSRYGDRYACGQRVDGDRRIVTTAGLGTSILPVRFGAPPDLWLLTLGPSKP